MSTAHPTISQRALPHDACYWGLLDISVLPSRRRGPEQFGFLFENILPLSLDELHPVYLRLGPHSVLAVAATHEVIEAAIDPMTIVLTPEPIPDTIGDKLGQAPVAQKHVRPAQCCGPFCI